MKKSTTLFATTALTGLTVATLFGAMHHVSAAEPAAAAPGSTLQQRVDQRKAERALTLSDQDQKRLVATCVAAQSKVRLLQNPTTDTLKSHAKAYDTVDARLFTVIGSLKLANQDTFGLQKQRQALVERTEKFQETGNNYKQTLDDLVVINCAADPTGFKALLETARLYYTSLKTQSADTRDYTVNTIKPTLTLFTAEMQTKSVNEDN